MHWFPGLQSLFVTHGQAHLPTAVLQRWVRQFASAVHGSAMGDGVDRPPGAAGATGAGAEGAGSGVGAGAGGAGAGVAAGAGGYA
jgi:hypothetical protein